MPDYSTAGAVFPLGVYAIVGVDTGTEEFVIDGDQTARILVDDVLSVVNSTGNDGEYTVASTSYASGPDETTVTVNEDVTDATVDGEILHDEVADLLPVTGSHDDAADRDAAVPDQIAGAHVERLANELRALGQTLGLGIGLKVMDNAGLQVYHSGGRLVFGSGTPVEIAPGALTVADDDDSYVEVDKNGTVSSNVVGFSNEQYPLAIVTAASGDITKIQDRRSGIYLAEWTEANLDDLAASLFDPAAELTISSGVVTRTQNVHSIDTESDDASDELDTISGGADGMLVIVRAEDAARTVILKHNTGNLLLAGVDITLDDTDQYVQLLYDAAFSKWLLVGIGATDLSVYLKKDGSVDTANTTLEAATELTISGDAVTRTQVYHTIDTESDDASDDLDTISGGADGMMLFLRAENAARTVVLIDGTGNLELHGADLTLDDTNLVVQLVYDGTLSAWVLVGDGGGESFVDVVTLELGHGEIPDGITDEEIHRFQLQAGETFELTRLELQIKGGGSPANVSLNVYDSTGASQLDTVNAGSVSVSGGTSGVASLMLVRLTNSSGGDVIGTPIVRGRILA